MAPRPPLSTLFPYTTLFRSHRPPRIVSSWPDRVHGLEQRRRHKRHQSPEPYDQGDRKSTRLNSSHTVISYAVFCLKKKNRSPTSACTGIPHLPLHSHRFNLT